MEAELIRQQEEGGSYIDKFDLRGFYQLATLDQLTRVLAAWAPLSGLELLCVNVSTIPKEGVDNLIKFLEEKQSITSIDISILADEEKEDWEKLNQLASKLPSSINSVIFYAPNVARGEMDLFCSILAKNQNLSSLRVEGKNVFPVDSFVANTSQCESLTINNYINDVSEFDLTDRLFGSLRKNKTIKSLALISNLTYDVPTYEFKNLAAFLQENKTLKSLSFDAYNSNNLLSHLAAGLKGNTTLESLRIAYCGNNLDVLVEALAGACALHSLDFATNDESPINGIAGLLKLNAAKKTIKKLSITGFEGEQATKDDTFSYLKQNTSLTELSLMSNKKEDPTFFLQLFSALPDNLQAFYFQGETFTSAEVVEQVCKLLKSHPSLQKTNINLFGNEAFLELMKNYPTNITLSLSACDFRDLPSLVNILQDNPNVSFDSLDLCQTIGFGDSEYFEAAAVLSLIETLNANQTEIKKLKIVGEFGRKQVPLFENALNGNYSIESLELQSGAYAYHFFYPITNRNKYMAKQKRFKHTKAC